MSTPDMPPRSPASEWKVSEELPFLSRLASVISKHWFQFQYLQMFHLFTQSMHFFLSPVIQRRELNSILQNWIRKENASPIFSVLPNLYIFLFTF